jgi:hypothetical protein
MPAVSVRRYNCPVGHFMNLGVRISRDNDEEHLEQASDYSSHFKEITCWFDCHEGVVRIPTLQAGNVRTVRSSATRTVNFHGLVTHEPELIEAFKLQRIGILRPWELLYCQHMSAIALKTRG